MNRKTDSISILISILVVITSLVTLGILIGVTIHSGHQGADITSLQQEVEHYKQLAIDNANEASYWRQEAVNWKVLFEASPNEAWIIIGEDGMEIVHEKPEGWD